MRTLFIILVLLIAGFFLLRPQPKDPAGPLEIKPLTVTQAPGAAAPVIAKPSAPPAGGLNESIYTGYGMPALDRAWDAAALRHIATTLGTIGRSNPTALPSPETDYGRAFFNKLIYTTKRFHLLSPENKVATYNAFTGIAPAFSSAPAAKGRPRDRELALLTGIEFELIAGFTEDPSFIKDPRTQKSRTMQDLSGNTMVAKASTIHFFGPTSMIAQDVERRLKMIGDTATFGADARLLALSRISPHLPTIVSRLDLTNIRPVLEANRAAEPDAQIREYYNTLLLRIP